MRRASDISVDHETCSIAPYGRRKREQAYRLRKPPRSFLKFTGMYNINRIARLIGIKEWRALYFSFIKDKIYLWQLFKI